MKHSSVEQFQNSETTIPIKHHSSAMERFQMREADRERRAKEYARRLEEQSVLRERRLKQRQIQMELRFVKRQQQQIEHDLRRALKKKEQAFSRAGHHQAAIDRQNHSPIEFRYKEVYGKWPSALELKQAAPFLKRRRTDPEE